MPATQIAELLQRATKTSAMLQFLYNFQTCKEGRSVGLATLHEQDTENGSVVPVT